MTRKISVALIVFVLGFGSNLNLLFATEFVERAALVAPEIIPHALPQSDFSIQETGAKIGNVPDNMPSPHVGEGRGEEKVQSPISSVTPAIRKPGSSDNASVWIPASAGMTAGPRQLREKIALPTATQTITQTIKKIESRLPKKNFSVAAGLGSLSTIYDGARISMSASVLEPEESGGEDILSKLSKPTQAIKTIGTVPERVNRFETVNYGEGFPSPQGVFADFSGLIYVADYENRRVQIFDPSGKYLKTLETSFHPTGVFVDPHGLIYVGDTSNHSIEIFDFSFKHLRTLGNGRWTSANEGFKFPYDVFVDSKKHIYVVDTGNYRVQIFDYDGKYLHTLGTGKETSENDGFGLPVSVSVNSAGLIYVGDSVNNRVQVFGPDWKYLRTIRIDGKTEPGSHIFVDSNERIYVTDAAKQFLHIYDPSGKPLRTLGTGKETSANDGFNHPIHVFVDSKGLIYVTDNHNHRIQIFPSLEEMDAADKKSKDEAERFLSQKVTIPPAPQTDADKKDKPESAAEHFKIDWDKL